MEVDGNSTKSAIYIARTFLQPQNLVEVESMTTEEWLGSENQLGMDIWTRKYCNEGEDFEAWIQRISGGNEEIGK